MNQRQNRTTRRTQYTRVGGRNNYALPRTPPGGNRRTKAEGEWMLLVALGGMLALMLVLEKIRMAVLGW